MTSTMAAASGCGKDLESDSPPAMQTMLIAHSRIAKESGVFELKDMI